MVVIQKISKESSTGYVLDLGEGRQVRVSEDSLIKHRLLKGTELTEEMLEVIRSEASFDIGYQKALNYLSHQLRSESEIRQHLIKHEIDSEYLSPIIQKLRELSLLNDAQFAQSYVRTALRTTEKGPQGVKEFLIKKGIESSLIEEALLAYDETEQYKIGLKLAEKFVKKTTKKSHRDLCQALNQMLYVKGFDSTVIQTIVDDLELDKDDDAEFALLCQKGDQLWRRHQTLEPYKRNQKIKQSLYQKGFSMDDILRYLSSKEEELFE